MSMVGPKKSRVADSLLRRYDMGRSKQGNEVTCKVGGCRSDASAAPKSKSRGANVQPLLFYHV